MNRTNVVPALVLIGIGVALLIAQTTGIGGEAIVAVIGAGFLLAYAATRQYGFLIPGSIMSGLGVGIVYETQVAGSNGAPVLIGLGVGFLAIYAIDGFVRRASAAWWPLIPGGILATIGVLIGAGREDWLSTAGAWWPVVLIIIGAVMLFTQRKTGPPATDPENAGEAASA